MPARLPEPDRAALATALPHWTLVPAAPGTAEAIRRRFQFADFSAA